jgi:hypothetical protein
MNKDNFLNPKSAYHGESYTPETLVFNANLQEFKTQIGYIVSLETNGKLSSTEAYKRIKKLWKELKNSKKNLFDKEEDA